MFDAGDGLDAPHFDTGRDAADGIDSIVGPVDPCGPAPCGPIELCGSPVDGSLGAGNGLDDNCNGEVDETCRCDPNAMESCFPGPRDRRNVGACHDGISVCGELGTWQSCRGAVLPALEVCDGIDNNCDGRVDEDLPACATALACPSFVTGHPLQDFLLDGRTLDPSARAFSWFLECPPEIATCPAIMDPSVPVLVVHPVQSGRYVLHAVVTHSDGTTGSCAIPFYVEGSGLRLELDWDTKGGVRSSGVDMDLHVSILDPMRAASATWFSPDDCYYATCAAPGGVVDWSVSSSDARFAPNPDLSACNGAPPPNGDRWQVSGRCWNPRLDVDDITCDPDVRDTSDPAFCFVENVNIDQPPHDVVFRVLVNFYEDHGTCADATSANDLTHPRLLVNCAGGLRAEIGGVDDGEVPMSCTDNQARGSENWSWLAADIRFVTDSCGLEDCAVRPLRAVRAMFPSCSDVHDGDDVCEDAGGRIFIRHAGARPVDADLPSQL